MSTVEEAIETMRQARNEILQLQLDNAELLRALKLTRAYSHEMDAETDALVRRVIARAEGK